MIDKQTFKETYSTLHASEETVTEVMKMTQKRKATKLPRVALAAAVLVCALAATAVASKVLIPVMRDYFGGGAGYDQSGTLLGQTQTSDGWTMTLTDCVGDERNLYIGMDLTAPENIVLSLDSYRLEDWSITFPGLVTGGSSHYTMLPDADPTDNRISLALWYEALPEGGSLNGHRVRLSFGRLRHATAYSEEKQAWEYEYDSPSAWSFDTAISYPDNAIRLEPNVPVTTLDVGAYISAVELSPLSVYVVIEGDALEGHHDWVPKNAPDGYYGCMEYQEITAYTKDGTAIPLTDGLAGSGCSGGDADHPEANYLHLVRRFDGLVDLESLDSIEICGVSIPLH